MTSKTYFLQSFGCQMNQHDSERMAGLMEVAGYDRVETADLADVAIFNTCAIRENADNRLYGNLGRLRATKQATGMKIAVGGCLAEKDKQLVRRKAPWVDVVFGTRNIDKLPSLVAAVERSGVPIVEFSEAFDVFPSALPARRSVSHHAWVAIQYGCNNNCTFCIVPHVRGKEVSRPLGEILREAQQLVSEGISEISLLGQNVNSYGRDLTGRPIFSTLLRELNEISGLHRIRFTSPHPKDFKLDTALAMAECSNVCEHLHFPVQSGSDRVLKAMKRAYSRSSYLDKLSMARETIPGLAVSTDIIVGFPTETDEDFEDTLSLVEDVGFDASYTFQYSPRPFTEAADYAGQIDPQVASARFQRLKVLADDTSLARNTAEVGRIVEVSVDNVSSKKDAEMATGRSRTNKIVHFPKYVTSHSVRVKPGDRVKVKVVGAASHYLRGASLPVGRARRNNATLHS